MKIIIKLFLVFAFANNIYTQDILTNKVILCELNTRWYGEIEGAMHDISRAYKVRICTEDATLRYEMPMAFTNMTLAQTIDGFIGSKPDYIWRYERATDSVYVHPKTNALSMIRVGPISVTNAVLKTLFDADDILGFQRLGIKLTSHWGINSWMDETVSLEFDDAFVWEILDSISMQLPGKSWRLKTRDPRRVGGYGLYFYTPYENHEPQELRSRELLPLPPNPPPQLDSVFTNNVKITFF